jgi:hypothetical protein
MNIGDVLEHEGRLLRIASINEDGTVNLRKNSYTLIRNVQIPKQNTPKKGNKNK